MGPCVKFFAVRDAKITFFDFPTRFKVLFRRIRILFLNSSNLRILWSNVDISNIFPILLDSKYPVGRDFFLRP